jgi:hypothetical protein
MIVLIMRHMRFLYFATTSKKPDKNLTQEVRGLFPRVAKTIEISINGSQVVRGEFTLDGRPRLDGQQQALTYDPVVSVCMRSANSRSRLRLCHGAGLQPKLPQRLDERGISGLLGDSFVKLPISDGIGFDIASLQGGHG